jgi:hypothetical protein
VNRPTITEVPRHLRTRGRAGSSRCAVGSVRGGGSSRSEWEGADRLLGHDPPSLCGGGPTPGDPGGEHLSGIGVGDREGPAAGGQSRLPGDVGDHRPEAGEVPGLLGEPGERRQVHPDVGPPASGGDRRAPRGVGPQRRSTATSARNWSIVRVSPSQARRCRASRSTWSEARIAWSGERSAITRSAVPSPVGSTTTRRRSTAVSNRVRAPSGSMARASRRRRAASWPVVHPPARSSTSATTVRATSSGRWQVSATSTRARWRSMSPSVRAWPPLEADGGDGGQGPCRLTPPAG